MNRNYPKPGVVYTLAQIHNELSLDDSPSLMIRVGLKSGPVQNAHLTDEQLLSVPGMAGSEWRYLRTTHEWIPCFEYAGSADLKTFFDIEPLKDHYDPVRAARYLWVTPKGFPRNQEL